MQQKCAVANRQPLTNRKTRNGTIMGRLLRDLAAHMHSTAESTTLEGCMHCFDLGPNWIAGSVQCSHRMVAKPFVVRGVVRCIFACALISRFVLG